MSWLEIVAFVLLGFATGTYGTLVGVGGGLIIVPVLLFLHVAPKEAAGTSMAVVLANAASGAWSYHRQRIIDLRAGLIFALAGLPGAILGGYADQFVPRRGFGLGFGLFLALMSLRLFLSRRTNVGESTPPEPAPTQTASTQPARSTPSKIATPSAAWLAACLGFVVGFLASMLGIGGGIAYVPGMVYLFHYLPHAATATSTFIIALTAIFATASHAYYGDVLWGPAVAIAVGAVAGAQLGARLARNVASEGLMRLFGVAVLGTSIWLIYSNAAK
ncbi:MAG: hypothetical protein DLM53_09840 [Candidatus Eremiobacter antarcticus]|nr:sulfite exporter TauE/SafE family protein [Candidatus Eremiobacteraeota bacterium]MBC5808589.1 sulfite exporter TauE/SafE family protein [Candidatus Eremiobacteraeota bacterium]PZR61144.1 MAG: hypothetical protein DLM53_09840 [Candidatus Eremiobacter sp. RRmetagenome_bin22]